MGQIDTLFKRFERATNDYEMNIKEKNATTFETSSLYLNDIQGVKKEFDGLISKIEELISTIKSLKCTEEEYKTTMEGLRSLVSRMNEDTITIADLTRNRIYNASEEVFTMYEKEFKTYTDHYNVYLNTINMKFTAYNKYKSQVSEKERELEQLRTNNLINDASTVQDRISTLKSNMSRCLEDIESNLVLLEETNAKLKETLEKGLKKS